MNQSEQHQLFVDLLVEHQNQLFAYLFAMVHSRDDAEELYQQTSLVLWRKFDKFESGSNFFRWAARTAQLEALNFLKYRRRSKLQFCSEVIEQLADAAEAASQQESDRTTDSSSRPSVVRFSPKLPQANSNVGNSLRQYA